MASFYAKYRVTKGTLCGGVVTAETSRYSSRELLQTRIETIRETNPDCVIEVCVSRKHPEIFVHCKTPTAINCYCPQCRKLLTVADAKALTSGMLAQKPE
jgi:hypothetical protein